MEFYSIFSIILLFPGDLKVVLAPFEQVTPIKKHTER